MRFKYQKTHHCKAAIVLCMDFRFWEPVIEYLKTNNINDFDIIAVPGAAKEILDPKSNLVEKSLQVSSRLHCIEQIIIINHADCGAYGGRKKFDSIEQEKEFQLKQIKEAMNKIKQQIEVKKIKGLYVDLDKAGEKINFAQVN
ncbi:MAG: hypothetical protein GF332_02890 [Candidatus Moranbacteria bacterium]|nr:hypothetical protein [Candidatus Moranbacteria bacterium]